MSENPFAQFRELPPESEVNPFAQFRPEPEVGDAPVSETPQADFLERSMDSATDYWEGIPEALTGERKYGGSLRGVEVMADGLQTASNILIDGGLTLVDKLVPDALQEDISDFARHKWEQVAKQPIMQEIIAAAEYGGEKLAELQEKYPDEFNKVSEIITIGSVVSPVKSGSGGKSLIRKGKKQATQNRKTKVGDMLEPIGKKGDGDITMDGSTKVYKPSLREQAITDEVMRVPEVNPSKPYTYNRTAVAHKAENLAKDLEEYIVRRGNPEINRQSLTASLATQVNKLSDETLLTGDALGTGLKVYKQAQRFIDESDGTALGLLQARRNLDAWVRAQKPNAFNADLENGLSVSLRAIRGEMNRQVNKAMPSDFVRNSLDRQHLLWSGRDLLEAKAFKEADTALGRLGQKFRDQTGLHISMTPVGVAATGGIVGTLAASAPLMGAAAGAGTAMAGYGLLKALRGPQAKVLTGNLLKMAEDYPILAPEVNAIIQMAEGLEAEETDGGS